MTLRWSLVLVALVVVGVAEPAPAAGTGGACPTASGVTVVVDGSAAGGSVVVGCATGSPGSGFDALRGAGFSVDVVQSQPGFVCRIDGLPEDESCVDTPPASAYWSYWHATRGGDWEESTLGAGSHVPPPGSVEGWSYGGAGGASPPAIAPPPPIPTTTTTSTTRPTTTTTRPTTTTTTRPTTTTRATTTSSTTTSTVPIVTPTTAADTTTTETSTTTTEPIPTTSSAPTTTLAESSTTISLVSTSTPLVVAAPDDRGVDVLGIVMSIVAVLGVAAAAGWAVLRRRST